MINSQTKGKRFERKIAKLLNAIFGTNIRRTPNSGGLSIKGDLLDTSGFLENFHWELKAQQSLNIWKALEQSRCDCPAAKTPLVVFTRNQEESYVALKFMDFVNLLKELQEMKEIEENEFGKFKTITS